MGSARTARWEFFVTRWAAIAEFVSGTLKQSSADAAAAAAAARPHLSPQEAERLSVAARKAARARAVLHQLQEYDGRHVQLELRIRPLLDGLPALQAQLSAPAPAPAWPLALQAELFWQASQEQQQEQEAFRDRFGIAAALGGGPGVGPRRPTLTTCSWRDAARAPARVAGAARRLIEGPALDQLTRFCADRRSLAAELSTLSRQLEGVCSGGDGGGESGDSGDGSCGDTGGGSGGGGLPPTEPLEAACAALEARLPALCAREAACAALLQRAAARVDWAALAARLERRAAAEAELEEHARRGGLRAAGDYAGGAPHHLVAAGWPELAAALDRLQMTAAALAGGRAPPPSAWQEIVDDANAVARATAALADCEADEWEWQEEERRQGMAVAWNEGSSSSGDGSGSSSGSGSNANTRGATPLRRLCTQRISAAVFAAHMAHLGAAAGDAEQHQAAAASTL